MRGRPCCGEEDHEGGGGVGGRFSRGITIATTQAASTSTRHAGKILWRERRKASAEGGGGEWPQGQRCSRRHPHRRRRPGRPATPPHPVSRVVVALHFALVLAVAAGGRYDGGGGGGGMSEWQHPQRRSDSSRPSSSIGGGGEAWAARGGGGGGWGGDENRGGYGGGGGAGRRRGAGAGVGAEGGRGSRPRDGGTRGEARGWSERKKVGSESMREIIEVSSLLELFLRILAGFAHDMGTLHTQSVLWRVAVLVHRRSVRPRGRVN